MSMGNGGGSKLLPACSGWVIIQMQLQEPSENAWTSMRKSLRLERLKTSHIDDLTGLYRRNHACTKIKELLDKEQYANRKYALMLF